LLERRIPAVRLAPLARGVATLVPGAAIATAVAYGVQQLLDGPGITDASKVELAVQVLVPGAAAAIVVTAIAIVLRLPEIQTVREIVAAVVTRRAAA
jgi:hypothetical protein